MGAVERNGRLDRPDKVDWPQGLLLNRKLLRGTCTIKNMDSSAEKEDLVCY